MVEDPERVIRLPFNGSTGALLPDPTPDDLELDEALLQIIKVGCARRDSMRGRDGIGVDVLAGRTLRLVQS